MCSDSSVNMHVSLFKLEKRSDNVKQKRIRAVNYKIMGRKKCSGLS